MSRILMALVAIVAIGWSCETAVAATASTQAVVNQLALDTVSSYGYVSYYQPCYPPAAYYGAYYYTPRVYYGYSPYVYDYGVYRPYWRPTYRPLAAYPWRTFSYWY